MMMGSPFYTAITGVIYLSIYFDMPKIGQSIGLKRDPTTIESVTSASGESISCRHRLNKCSKTEASHFNVQSLSHRSPLCANVSITHSTAESEPTWSLPLTLSQYPTEIIRGRQIGPWMNNSDTCTSVSDPKYFSYVATIMPSGVTPYPVPWSTSDADAQQYNTTPVEIPVQHSPDPYFPFDGLVFASTTSEAEATSIAISVPSISATVSQSASPGSVATELLASVPTTATGVSKRFFHGDRLSIAPIAVFHLACPIYYLPFLLPSIAILCSCHH
jgi:hypothetical protein